MTPAIRILCVEDHAVVREGIALIIGLQPDMKVVASAPTGEEGVALFTQLNPDIVLMDLELPGMSGYEAIREITKAHPGARILVLTMHHDTENIFNAMQAGATTYLLKDMLSQDLIRVIREVHAGKHSIPEPIAAQLAQRAAEPTLTSREIEVVNLIARGLSNKQVATVLGISDQTVHAHLRNIFDKLHVSDRTAAVTTALRRGIVHVR